MPTVHMARQGLQPTRGSTCRFSTASPDHQEPSTGRHMFAPDLDDISICKGQEPAGTISAHLPHRRPPFDSHGLDCQSSANSSRCSGPGDTIPGRNPFPEVIDPMIEPVKRLHQTRPLSGNAPDLAQKAKLRHANSPPSSSEWLISPSQTTRPSTHQTVLCGITITATCVPRDSTALKRKP